MTSRICAIAMLAVALTACTPRPPTFATIQASGPNVFLDGARVTDPEEVFPGATVTTGTASSALVTFFDGSRLQLAPTSDPRLGDDGEAITVSGGDDGQYRVTTGRWDVRWITALLRGLMSSDVIVHASRNRAVTVYVLRGQFDPEVPDLPPVTAGQSLTVTAAGGVRRGTISAAQRIDLTGDFTRWSFRPRSDGNDRDDGGYDRGGTSDTGSTDGGSTSGGAGGGYQ